MSTQLDTERATIYGERRELAEHPDDERAELIGRLRKRGLSDQTSRAVADEPSQRDTPRADLNV